MIEVRHLTRTYLSRRSPKSKESFVSVNDVSFSLLENTPYALVGESGSGKSTLAMMLAAILPPTKGTSADAWRSSVGFTKQPRGA